jgi:hypothetical protein
MTEPLITRRLDRGRWTVISITVAVAAGSLMYRLIVSHRLEQTSLLFIGIPTLLAICLALTPKAKSVTGIIIKGIAIALLLSGILLGEGFVCIVMAAPLFFAIGIIVGLICDAWLDRKRAKLTFLVLMLGPMSMEGVAPQLSFDRMQFAEVTQIVNAPSSEVEAALSRSPRVSIPLPAFLRIGFPRPQQAWGSGLSVGSTRTIHFAGGEGKPGDLTLTVVESQPGLLRFKAVEDRSKIAHWLEWKSAEVHWERGDGTHTRVTWRLGFERRLDPAWYFGPWEHYAVKVAAKYLIEANTTSAN